MAGLVATYVGPSTALVSATSYSSAIGVLHDPCSASLHHPIDSFNNIPFSVDSYSSL